MNNPSKEALYYFNRTAAFVDSDRDDTPDNIDPYPYCSDETGGSCNEAMPMFSVDIVAAGSRYADQTMAELIPNHADEFIYDGPYTWATWLPMANRMQGHLWRKVAGENLRAGSGGSGSDPAPDLSLPNLELYPGKLVRAEILGSWDTLPVGSSGFEQHSDRQIPVFLSDAFGRYGEIDGETWDYPIEALPLFSVPSQINDAYMAVITESDTSALGLGIPYGPEYRIRNGSLAHGVCYAEELNVLYAASQLEVSFPYWLRAYYDIIQACGDAFINGNSGSQ